MKILKSQAILLPIYLVFALSKVLSDCISLKGSLACPEYENYSISTDSNDLFSWSPPNSVEAFDKALLSYVGSVQDSNLMQIYYRCDGYTNDTSKEIAATNANILYRRSVVCAQVISGTNGLLKCYNQAPKLADAGLGELIHLKRDLNNNQPKKRDETGSVPKPLCKATCMQWANSVVNMFKNKNACANTISTDPSQAQKNVMLLCEQYPLNGEGDCISGEKNEINTCGFRNIYGWCSNCDYSKKFAGQCAASNDTLSSIFFNGDIFSNTAILIDDKNKTAKGESEDRKNKNEQSDVIGKDTNSDSKKDENNQRDNENSGNTSGVRSKSKSNESTFKVLSIALGVLLLVLVGLIAAFFFLIVRSKKRIFGGSKFSKGSDGSSRFEKSDMDPLSKQIITKSTRTSENILNPNVDFVDLFLKSVGVPRIVLHPFFAKRDDEISLKTGEHVQIQIVFDDGWAVGKNLNTGKEGSFPLMCVIKNLPNQLPQSWSALETSKEMQDRDNGFDNAEEQNSAMESQKFPIKNLNSYKAGDKSEFKSINIGTSPSNQKGGKHQNLSHSPARRSSDIDSKRSSNTKSSLFSMSNVNKESQYSPNEHRTLDTPIIAASKNRAAHDPTNNGMNMGLNFIPTESGRYGNTYSSNYNEFYEISPKRPSNLVHK